MPAISFPLAQSKAARRSVELSISVRVPWTPSYCCDQTHICRPSGANRQSCPNGRESSPPAGETALLVLPISCFTPQPNVKNDTPNHGFDFGLHATVFSRPREGEVTLWL